MLKSSSETIETALSKEIHFNTYQKGAGKGM